MQNVALFFGYVFIFLILAIVFTVKYFEFFPEQYVKACIAFTHSESYCQTSGR